MVNRLLQFFSKETNGVHQVAYLLGFFAICSQLLALIRDRILASQFGAGETLDLYYSAFRIPDLLFATVASIVSISVIIPFLIASLEKGEEEARTFVDTVFTFFFLAMCGVGIIACITTPFFLRLLFPAFAAPSRITDFNSLVSLTRILLLSPIFLGFSNFLASITQIHKRFLLYALSPLVYNLGIIIGILFLYPVFGLVGLGWGVALGALMHFAIQLPAIIRDGLAPRLRFPIKFNLIKKVIYTSIPRTLTVSSNELTELFLISFASFLIPGSISIFNFSFNLQSVPFSIIGVSYSLAAFPLLSRLFSQGSHAEFLDHMVTSSRHIIFWSIPVSVLFVVLRAQIVRTLLGAGQFNWSDTRLTAAALALFIVSLIAQNLVTLFVRAYYSRSKTLAPLLMNVFSSIFIITLSYGLVQLFQHNIFFQNFIESLLKVSGIPGTVVLMLPLGFSIGVILNMIIHWIGFNTEFPSYSPKVLRTLFQSLSASVIMGYIAYIFLNVFDTVFDINTLLGIFLQGFCSGVIGICSAVLVLYFLRSTELREIWATLHKKIWRVKVVGPDVDMS